MSYSTRYRTCCFFGVLQSGRLCGLGSGLASVPAWRRSGLEFLKASSHDESLFDLELRIHNSTMCSAL